MPACYSLFPCATSRALAVGALLLVNACAADVTAPGGADLKRTKAGKGHEKAPSSLFSPSFLFVSSVSGAPQIYRFRGDTIMRLTFSDMPDVNPHVAASAVVFASYRDGDGEIYMADRELSSVRRLTYSHSTDDEPALSPAGDRIAFTSYRTGTSKIFLMDSSGANQTLLETGAPAHTPETRPSWSPAGDQIVFASSRTGTSQIFVVGAAGGVARQLTQEAVGAFDPVFTEDGTQIVYTAWLTAGKLRVVTLGTGEILDYSAGDVLSTGEGHCKADGCIATANPYGGAGDIVFVTREGSRRTLVSRVGNDFRPVRLDR